MRILIVEDDDKIASKLEEKFLEYDKNLMTHVVNNLKDAKHFLSEYTYNIISLDIHLPDGDGLEFTQYIRSIEKNKRAYLFVITSNDSLEVAFRAYDQSRCFKFFKKPIEDIQLMEVLDEVKRIMHIKPKEDYFVYSNRSTKLKLPMKDIVYFEVFYKKCIIKTFTGTYQVGRCSLKSIMENLPSEHYMQVHRSYIINLNHLIGVEVDEKKWVARVRGIDMTIPVGGKYLDDLKNIIFD